MRKIEFQTLDDRITGKPMPLSEMGGAPFVRYMVRVAELEETLGDMLEAVQNAEMDATYYGSESEHLEKFTQRMEQLEDTMNSLRHEAKEVAGLHLMGG